MKTEFTLGFWLFSSGGCGRIFHGSLISIFLNLIKDFLGLFIHCLPLYTLVLLC